MASLRAWVHSLDWKFWIGLTLGVATATVSWALQEKFFEVATPARIVSKIDALADEVREGNENSQQMESLIRINSGRLDSLELKQQYAEKNLSDRLQAIEVTLAEQNRYIRQLIQLQRRVPNE